MLMGFSTRMKDINVVLDSNFILDVFFFNNPSSVSLFHRLERAGAHFYRSSSTLEELRHVLGRDEFAHSKIALAEVLERWSDASINFDSCSPSGLKCRDPLDQKFIDLAFSVSPSYLVTKDKDILRLRRKASKLRMKFRRPDEFIANCQY